MTIEHASPAGTKQRRRRKGVPRFYGDSLDAAMSIKGLDEEIGILRDTLRKIVKRKHGKEIELMLRGMAILARLVATRHRLSKKSQEDLAASMAGVLSGIRAQLGWDESDGA